MVKSVDALQEISSQSFDSDGNRDGLTDPNKNQTQFTFDLSGRLTQETLATGDQVKYTYSARDLLESVTNGRNQQRQFKYDAAGRLTSWTDPDGSVSYTFDGNGNVLTVTDASGTITREYNQLNRITKYTDQQGNTLQYEYDPVGNLITLIYPNGKQVHYEYNSANQLITVIDWAGHETHYDYDPNARLISTLRPNGTKMTRIYDEAGQLTQQKDIVITTGEVISQFDFKYDAAGNIIEEKTLFEPEPEINLEMTYQVANRLATINDQAVQVDSDGNLTKGPLNGELTNFTFDSRNRLIQAGSTVYRYDAENQRIGVNQTNYVVNSQPALSQVLVKTEADGTQTFYVYGLGLIGQETNGEYTNYHFDFRGSTVALTDEMAQVIERFQYSPYGLLLSGDASKTQFLFNGMYGVMTDDNGLYYMRARFYSPNIRRFINQDILLGNIVDGQSLNRFAYVTSNPISFVDPFGLFQLTPEYAKYLKTSGLVVTQLDSPMIGPGDIAGITLLLIGTGIDVYIILNSLHDDKHMDVNQALACIEDGSHGGDCNAIIEMINLLIGSIKFRKIDLKRHLARNGTSYAQHPVYRSHKKRLNLEKQALRKLVELARLYNCAYDPEAEQLMN